MRNAILCTALALLVSCATRAEAAKGGYYIIDLMEFYTDDAVRDCGSGQAAEAKIRTAVSILNEDMLNSGINNVQFNLVYVGLMNFSTTDPATLLGILATDPQVTYLRNLYRADLVGVWQTRGSIASQGYASSANPMQAFHVIADDQDVHAYHLLSHEIGHNLGALHDTAADTTDPNGFEHGYCHPWVVGSDAPAFRDIMATSCPGLPLAPMFSNPGVLYDGVPAGVAGSADSAQMMRGMIPAVSSYR